MKVMPKKESEERSSLRSLLGNFFPVNLDLKKVKIEDRKILEFDPYKIKPGEGIVVKIPKWGGLTNVCFAILNIGGKKFLVRQLKI